MVTTRMLVAAFGVVGLVLGGGSPALANADTTPPPVARQFYINGVTATDVSMQWGPGVPYEPSRYHVYRNGALLATSISSAYWDRGLTPGATYSYHVVSVDAAGNASAPTRTLTVTTRGPGVQPAGPTNLRATEVSPARVTLTFDRPHDEFDVGAFVVFDGTTAVASVSVGLFAEATTSATIRHLSPGTTHQYTVRASRPAPYGLSAPSNGLTIGLPTTTDGQPPSVPSGLVATESSYACDFADLTWNQSTDNADSQAAIDYEIFIDGVFYDYIRGVGRYTNAQLLSHGAHTFTVRARDSSGNASAHSAAAIFTVDPFCPLES